MPSQSIELFGETLVKLVRDAAIRNCTARLAGNAKSPIAIRWREVTSETGVSPVSDIVVSDCVDEAIFCLLDAIDSGGLRLSVTGADGAVTDLTFEGLGELAGWYLGADSWRRKYSSHPVENDLK
jgi:hypothetical protein